MPPEIEALREETLAGQRGLISDVQGDIQTLRGLENPFIQARVQPFVEERERARRGAIRRGVAGPLTALATNPFQARIAEQGALATFESQQAIRANQELIRGLLTDISGQGRQLFEEELRLLGLSQDQITQIIASQLAQPTASVTEARGETQQGLFAGVPALAGFLGGLCWVAREVYGADNPRWLEFRHWVLLDAPLWFHKLYADYGERFAGWIKDKPRVKRLVKWGMEKVLNHG